MQDRMVKVFAWMLLFSTLMLLWAESPKVVQTLPERTLVVTLWTVLWASIGSLAFIGLIAILNEWRPKPQ